VNGLAKTTDPQTLSADSMRRESSGNSRKALSIKACKPWVNTNTAVQAAQHNSEQLKK
jgi:hypothetical protein